MSDTENTQKNENSADQVEAATPETETLVETVQTETEVESETLEAKQQVDEWKSKAAYLAAELDNVKKRAVRDRMDTIKFANESLLKAIVPVVDNLHLALNSGRGAKDEDGASSLVKSLVEGVEMTLKHFEQTLAQAGVEFIKAEGESFDPEVHEAVGQLQDPSKEDGVILNEVQRGFKLSGRVGRTSKVIVNKK